MILFYSASSCIQQLEVCRLYTNTDGRMGCAFKKQEQYETVTAERVVEVIRPLLIHLPLDIFRTRQNRW